jgi:hypothetical protein
MIQMVHDLDDARKAIKRTTVYFVLLIISACLNIRPVIDGERNNIILMSITGGLFLAVFGLRYFFLYKENRSLNGMVEIYAEDLGARK